MKTKIPAFILFFMFLLQNLSAQTSISDSIFTLHGRMHGMHRDSVLLFYENSLGQAVFQSRPIYDDRFIITDSLTRPTFATVAFKDQGEILTDSAIEARSHELYLEPGRLYLSGDIAKMDSLKLVGSNSELEFVQLNKSIAGIKAEMKPLTERFNKEKDPEKAARLGTLFAPYDNRIKAITCQFFSKYPNSYVGLHELVNLVNQMGLDSARHYYETFDDQLKLSYDGKQVAAAIEKIASVQPGKSAVDFMGIDTCGQSIALIDFKGKYVLLNFWATWSAPSKESNAHLFDIYNKYKADSLVIIGIADNDASAEAWRKAAVSENIYHWTNLLSGAGTDNDINEKYAIHYLPTKILIDPDGKIIGRFGDNNIAHADLLLDRTLQNIFKDLVAKLPAR